MFNLENMLERFWYGGSFVILKNSKGRLFSHDLRAGRNLVLPIMNETGYAPRVITRQQLIDILEKPRREPFVTVSISFTGGKWPDGEPQIACLGMFLENFIAELKANGKHDKNYHEENRQ
jgi:hypothetical protein